MAPIVKQPATDAVTAHTLANPHALCLCTMHDAPPVPSYLPLKKLRRAAAQAPAADATTAPDKPYTPRAPHPTHHDPSTHDGYEPGTMHSPSPHTCPERNDGAPSGSSLPPTPVRAHTLANPHALYALRTMHYARTHYPRPVTHLQHEATTLEPKDTSH